MGATIQEGSAVPNLQPERHRLDPWADELDADAAEFLERCHGALRQHTGGNPRPFLELWSHADDVSLMGGVGGHQVGIEQVSALLTAAAKTLDYETWSAENLVPASARRSGSRSNSSGLRGTSTVRRKKCH